MKRRSEYGKGLLLSFLLWAVPHAAAAGAEVSAAFSPARATVGDRVTVSVTVDHAPRRVVTFALPDSSALMPFVLVGTEVAERDEGRTVFTGEFGVFDTGKQALPEVLVTVRDTVAGGETVVRAAPEGMLTVEALTDSTVTELMPIKPVKEPFRPSVGLLPIVITALAAALLLLVFLLSRKGKRAAGKRPAQHAKDALREIRRLEKGLEKELPPGECYERLSLLLRRYLERRHGIRAFEEVTSEIGRELSMRSVPSAETLLELLAEADLVKFAEGRPAVEECRRSLRRAGEALKAGPGDFDPDKVGTTKRSGRATK